MQACLLIVGTRREPMAWLYQPEQLCICDALHSMIGMSPDQMHSASGIMQLLDASLFSRTSLSGMRRLKLDPPQPYVPTCALQCNC